MATANATPEPDDGRIIAPRAVVESDITIDSDGVELSAHVVAPAATRDASVPCVVLVHGFPTQAGGASREGQSYHPLAVRLAQALDWVVMAINLRGVGDSTGEFSPRGWLRDLRNAVAAASTLDRVGDVWLAGFGTGGALSIVVAATEPMVRGVAAFAPPVDFRTWAADPERLVEFARSRGAIDGSVPDIDGWIEGLADVSAEAGARGLAPRPLLVVHGSEDEAVAFVDQLAICDAHGTADLRHIAGAGHALRYDPRALAILTHWLARRQFMNQRPRLGESFDQV